MTQRNNPVVSSANIRTIYAYDAAGRHASMLLVDNYGEGGRPWQPLVYR